MVAAVVLDLALAAAVFAALSQMLSMGFFLAQGLFMGSTNKTGLASARQAGAAPALVQHDGLTTASRIVA
ncbi:hypothetical protein LJR039_007155 [Pseudorhodoferax sp. LjRoot39]